MSVSWDALAEDIRSVPVPVLERLAAEWDGRAADMERRSRLPGSVAAWGAQAETLRAAANQLRDAMAIHGARP